MGALSVKELEGMDWKEREKLFVLKRKLWLWLLLRLWGLA